MPVPPLYLRNIYDPVRKKVVREVIDGQQRLRSVLDFIDGKYSLSPKLDAPYAGKRFEALGEDEQKAVMSYRFICETFDGISDPEVLDIFHRLNTHSVPLSKQELRNGRFFGYFKQACYNLARTHLEFWRSNNIFSEGKIQRMLEVELTSELLIAQMAGMQDKKGSIDQFYLNYDKKFPKRETYETQFQAVIDVITQAIGDELREIEFHRPPFFYTLFCVIYHHVYVMPGQRHQSPKKRLTAVERDSLKNAVNDLSQVIAAAKQEKKFPDRYQNFVAACMSQTDNIAPRQTRFTTLYTEAFR